MKKTVVMFAGAMALISGAGLRTAGADACRRRRAAGPAAGSARRRIRATWAAAECADNPYNCADAPEPAASRDTVWIEEMTWMDVRDALKAGKTTVIIPTGGIEPNGPWLVTGKHNYVLRANCDAIARKLGNALCAPIIELRARRRHRAEEQPHGAAPARSACAKRPSAPC